MFAWVLWWRYSDGSNAEIVRAYLDQIRADQDFELLRGGTDMRIFELSEVVVFGDIPPSIEPQSSTAVEPGGNYLPAFGRIE